MCRSTHRPHPKCGVNFEARESFDGGTAAGVSTFCFWVHFCIVSGPLFFGGVHCLFGVHFFFRGPLDFWGVHLFYGGVHFYCLESTFFLGSIFFGGPLFILGAQFLFLGSTFFFTGSILLILGPSPFCFLGSTFYLGGVDFFFWDQFCFLGSVFFWVDFFWGSTFFFRGSKLRDSVYLKIRCDMMGGELSCVLYLAFITSLTSKSELVVKQYACFLIFRRI